MVGVWDGTGVAVGETVTSGVDVGVGVTQPARQVNSRQTSTILK